ncbi:MAG TPA: hypothetical protein VN612_15260 [Acidobacteriaceae bacterium]|nr:hypothetical protein [Acidobacteriaceae bacterium]
MRITRIRLQLAAFLFILLPATAGVVAVHASATCEKFVRTYVTKPVRNRVSQATADAWAAWRIEHPHWKPNPALHRPKYVMTREEQVKKVEFACEVPTLPVAQKIFFDTARIDPPPALLPPTMETETSFPTLPTEVAEVVPLPPLGSFLPPPAMPVPEVQTGIPGPTPEPMSLLMVASGIGGLLLFGMRRQTPSTRSR